MKNLILTLSFLLIGVGCFAQTDRKVTLNKETNLLDVTYFHDNGVVSQTGSYTLDGKLQGDWLTFSTDGEKIVSASYDHGKKVGKWFYWIDKTLKEVDYKYNSIVSVREWKDDTSVAIND